MRRPMLVLLVLATALVAAGGALHLRDWLSTYRGVPWEVPGAWVVRVGFLVNAAVSVVVGVGLVAAAVRFRRLLGVVTLAAIGLQLASIAAVILSRHGGVFGWVERGWTTQARQALAVEIAAAVVLVAAKVAAGAGSLRGSHDVGRQGARL